MPVNFYDDTELKLHLIITGRQGLAGQVGAMHQKLKRAFAQVDTSITEGDYYSSIAGQAVGGDRVVRVSGGQIFYADAGTLSHAYAAFGITAGAASLGSPINVITSGSKTEPSWSWIPGDPIFCGLNGLLTQTFSGSWAFSRIMGVALTTTSIWVHPQAPIIL